MVGTRALDGGVCVTSNAEGVLGGVRHSDIFRTENERVALFFPLSLWHVSVWFAFGERILLRAVGVIEWVLFENNKIKNK